MVWNTFYYDFNRKEIKIFNVFNSHRFSQEIEELFKKDWTSNFKDFSEELRHAAMYAFWGKCEYETVITSWPSYISADEFTRLQNEMEQTPASKHLNICSEAGKKIDVYYQLYLNWDIFATYVWENYCQAKENV